MLITAESHAPAVEAEMRRLQYSPEERKALLRHARPFRLRDWLAKAPPASAEELAEMDELLRAREVEREASLASEADLLP